MSKSESDQECKDVIIKVNNMTYYDNELNVIKTLQRMKTKLETLTKSETTEEKVDTNKERDDIINTVTLLLKDVGFGTIIKTIKKWKCYCTKFETKFETNDDNKCHQDLFEKIISAIDTSLNSLNIQTRERSNAMDRKQTKDAMDRKQTKERRRAVVDPGMIELFQTNFKHNLISELGLDYEPENNYEPENKKKKNS